jgi:hypothetical protein
MLQAAAQAWGNDVNTCPPTVNVPLFPALGTTAGGIPPRADWNTKSVTCWTMMTVVWVITCVVAMTSVVTVET